jgi:hypothetical protein
LSPPARLAVDIDRGLVPRLRHGRIELKLPRMLVELPRLGVEHVELAQHDLAAVVLAHLHRVALERRPHPVPRVAVHGHSDLVAMDGIAAVFGAERRQAPALPREAVAVADRARQVPVEIGEEIEPRSLVMTDFGQHRVPGQRGVGRWSISGHYSASRQSCPDNFTPGQTSVKRVPSQRKVPRYLVSGNSLTVI